MENELDERYGVRIQGRVHEDRELLPDEQQQQELTTTTTTELDNRTDVEKELGDLHNIMHDVLIELIVELKRGGMTHTSFCKWMSRVQANNVRMGFAKPSQGIARLNEYVRVFEEA